MNRPSFHDECAFGWAHDFAGSAEHAKGCVWVDFAVAFEKQDAWDWAYVEAIFAVGRAFFRIDVEQAVEDFAYAYCAFWAFDFA